MTGFRDFDCGSRTFPNICNFMGKFPQDVMFDMYSCLSNKSTVIIKDNVVEDKIYDNFYPLFS